MTYGTVAIIIAIFSLILNVILFIKVVQLKTELDHIKQSTKLTREELEKIQERLKRLKDLK
ncbi:hypothetical protein [Methanofervidicoccus abyssi]|uniref:Uncharacterized protein n=1 Tax=Methanofervidicoccus abyssi TaxID=2082189 RepID=A0A401HRK3_9EURY|nr:hypothetical protein [Methanofervidicoccus abyssi]GBF36822.1 hypothetical protein MHHB_P1052 [Methanofervidicoccus abyssi]